MSVVVGKELPEGWIDVMLEDVVYFQEGPGLRKYQYGDNTGIPFLNIRTFENGRINKEKCKFIKKEEFENRYEHFLLNEGDLVVSSSGTIGKSVIVKKEDLPIMLNTSVIRFRSKNENLLLQSYLKHYLNSQHFLNQINLEKTGSTISNYGPTHLKKTHIIFPSIHEQKRIVAKIEELFSLVDSAKDTLEKTKILLKQYRQSILKHAFEGKLTEEWRNTHECNPIKLDNISQNCKSNNRKFHSIEPEVFSNLPKLPPSWSWTYLSNIGKLERGKSKHRPRNDPILFGGNYPFIQTGVIRNSKQKILSFEQTYNEKGLSQSRLFPSGTLCITIAANIAETGILTFDSCFPDSIVGFTPDNNIVISEFVMYYIESNKSKINSIAPSTAQKNINLEILQNIFIPIMNFNEIEVIVEKIEESFSLIDKNEILIDKLLLQYKQIKNSILKHAFEGKLVPQDPNDEPAEVLLQRIREEKNGK